MKKLEEVKDMDNRSEAKRLLKHYFRLIATNAGVPWDSDNDAEVEGIVECIIDAAREKLEQES